MSPATPKVLVVDDNQDAADSLATLLGVMGYEVRMQLIDRELKERSTH